MASVFLMALVPHAASGRAFYVSTNGSNSNPGTLGQPWQTLGKANATLVAGDTCYVRGGEYHDMINPANSGSPGKYIVYRNFPGEAVTVDGLLDSNIKVVEISSDYVVVDGFTIRNQDYTKIQGDDTYWVNLDGDHILFTQNRIIADGDVVDNVGFKNYQSRGIVVGGHFVTVEHCYLRGTAEGIEIGGSVPRFDVFRFDTVNATMWNNIIVAAPPPGSDGYMGLLIEHCVLDTSYGEDNIQFQPDYVGPAPWKARNIGAIIRHNYMANAAENFLDLKGTNATNVFEHNVMVSSHGDDDGPYYNGTTRAWSHTPIYGDHSGGGGIELGSGDSSLYQIVRFNLIGDNDTGAKMYQGGHYYNNTFYNNARDFNGTNSQATSSWFTGLMTWNMAGEQRAFLNNIVYANSHLNGGANNTACIYWLMDGGDKFDLNYNLYWDASGIGNAGTVQFRHRTNNNEHTTVGFNNWRNELTTASGYSYMLGKDAASRNADPLFVNAPSLPSGYDGSWDFNLRPGSPARDAGGPLTRTTNSGTNQTTIGVVDPHFFSDGYGISDEGDSIVVGPNGLAKIISIDYRGSTLTVQSPISWNLGDPVYYAFRGSAPDIGAYEFGDASPTPKLPSAPTLAAPPNGVTSQPTNQTLRWTSAPAAALYHVQISVNSAFTSTFLNQTGIADTSYQATSLDNGTTYYWRVRATNAFGSGPWSATRSFITIPADTTSASSPTLAAPSNTAKGAPTNPTLSWYKIAGATSYRLQVSVSPSFAPAIVDKAGIAGTSFVVSGLSNRTTYYWRVNATTSSGGTTLWSNPKSFTTIVSSSDTNLVGNAAFDNGTDFWDFYTDGDGEFTTGPPGFQGSPQAATIKITKAGNDVQLHQYHVPLDPDTTYFLSFVAFSSTGHDIDVSVLKSSPPYSDYGLYFQHVDLTTTWKSFTFEFRTSPLTTAVSDGQLQFWLAPYAGAGDVYAIGNVVLSKTTSTIPVTVTRLPRDYFLDQNYPNPFNPSTIIRYKIPHDGKVTLKVHDILGREIATLVDVEQKAGGHQVGWDGTKLASGVYFYTLQTGTFTETRKFLLIK